MSPTSPWTCPPCLSRWSCRRSRACSVARALSVAPTSPFGCNRATATCRTAPRSRIPLSDSPPGLRSAAQLKLLWGRAPLCRCPLSQRRHASKREVLTFPWICWGACRSLQAQPRSASRRARSSRIAPTSHGTRRPRRATQRTSRPATRGTSPVTWPGLHAATASQRALRQSLRRFATASSAPASAPPWPPAPSSPWLSWRCWRLAPPLAWRRGSREATTGQPEECPVFEPCPWPASSIPRAEAESPASALLTMMTTAPRPRR
mmetsp:Transcript_3888/g.14477  ORF Transcript_3888/g.14477 Transcript_3888/m.14477 type:complete len:263 (+) Transcript_3888:1578-2366(+)